MRRNLIRPRSPLVSQVHEGFSPEASASRLAREATRAPTPLSRGQETPQMTGPKRLKRGSRTQGGSALALSGERTRNFRPWITGYGQYVHPYGHPLLVRAVTKGCMSRMSFPPS